MDHAIDLQTPTGFSHQHKVSPCCGPLHCCLLESLGQHMRMLMESAARVERAGVLVPIQHA
jgi:hypothetical protein